MLALYEHRNGDCTTELRFSADKAQHEYGKAVKSRPIKLGEHCGGGLDEQLPTEETGTYNCGQSVQ